jgi:phosphomannomutase
MSVSFGTSGLRGLVSALTEDVVSRYIHAFVAVCPIGSGLYLGRDLRASSPQISDMIIATARRAGIHVTDCGEVSTPALALAATTAGAAAVMVTGSHIPDDRNGLKFYLPTGEISKADEAAITAALVLQPQAAAAPPIGALVQAPDVMAQYVARYANFFGPQALMGLKLGVYQHSGVARDALLQMVQNMGAQAVALGRAATFIPVDTESVGAGTRVQLAAWAAEMGLDAILSTDGDGDRPLLTDAAGTVIAGDILGILTARSLGALHICTPVSSNSMIEEMGEFPDVTRSKIGSPYVIAAMLAAQAQQTDAKVVGFEANGGFLLGFNAAGPQGPLPALMTRDAFLPLIAPLAAARAKGLSLREMLADLPSRVTAADRLSPVSKDAAALFLDDMMRSETARSALLAQLRLPAPTHLDVTDGLRLSFAGGRVVHLRPSGNAPEFRIYIEAESDTAAQALLQSALSAVGAALAVAGGKAA